jgi:hypothetical protein
VVACYPPLIEHVDGARESWRLGYRVTMVDGNGLAATEHRLKALRDVQAAALPGQSLVVYEPAHGVVTDVFPCEDGHAQERALFGSVRNTVQTNDLWIADRNFWTRALLCDIGRCGGLFITRHHEG